MKLSTSMEEDHHDDVDVNALKNLDDIKAAYERLSIEEDAVNEELEELLSRQKDLESRLRSLSDFQPRIGKAETEAAEKLSSVISFTSDLAQGVSAKVKQLDVAKNRVSECQNRVNDLIDLKLCSEGVCTALKDEDYEQAAGHIHRFLAMDEGLLKLTATDINHEGFSNLEASLKTLHEAEGRVKEVVSWRFDEAVKVGDLASIERFFKLFPLINMHEIGLKKFTVHLCSKVVEASKKNLKAANETVKGDPRWDVIFADTLTLLFEGIARTVEIHQPLIETYYGHGRLITVISMIQEECDRQSLKIFSEFKKKRRMSDKAHRIKEFLRSSSSSSTNKNTEKIPAKDLDHVLGELTLLQARTEMYFKFIRKRVTADLEIANNENKESEIRDFEKRIHESGLCRSVQDLLSDYILLEQYFMSENIHKAIDQDDVNPDQLTSLMLDDIFFILKKCIKRALSGQNIDGFCAVVNNACTLLESDFCTLLQNQLKLGFPSGYLDLTQAYNVLQTSFQQGKLQGSDTERQKTLFLTYLNNADNCAEYITMLRDSLTSEITSMMANKTEYEKAKIENCLSGLPSAGSRFRSVLDQGLQQLRQSVVKPRIKPWVDTFGSHNIDDEEFTNQEANDPFIQQLILNLDGLLATFKKSLTTSNYDALVAILSEEVTSQLEKVSMKSSFSRLGGLQFDREVRSLVSFLTSITTWTIRDKFARLTQIATILNLEVLNEISDIWGSNSGSMNWRLSPNEVRQILQLRVDFKKDEIKRIKL